ncbi:MAG: hydroxyethylthiazole kinase [Myxococcaceae bacterium]|nr:hydroxyethylthiazole kinase [Myxococcaceae bacterium]MBH2006222.1 hydroxyethylthiazole kinase [Myxococcaceae bacterium]
MNLDFHSIVRDLELVRRNKPLVLNLTNFVSAGWVANGLLAIGAAPVMSQAEEEIEELVASSDSLVLNIGTADRMMVGVMKRALRQASQLGKPVVLDPVGAGATPCRTRIVQELLEIGGVCVVRGNPSEVAALAGGKSTTRGVETSLLPAEALEYAYSINQQYGCVVVVSGPDDLIVQSQGTARLYNGTAMMARITGMGCLASAMIAAFCAVQPVLFSASLHAMASICIAGEKAASTGCGLGSYQTVFLDVLANLDEEIVKSLLAVECL